MLSHRPFGTEHPYRYDLDQRVPPRPLPGEPYEIRVLADEDVIVAFDDGTVVEAVRTDPATVELDHGARPAPAAGSAGHLSVASGLGPETGGLTLWVAHATGPAEPVSYTVNGQGPYRLEPGRPRWRITLPLAEGEHVIGFGERFHGLDQRGEIIDAVVFEQYKRQGHRTYLPMPFAVVTGGGDEGGWGFHVRTSRRTYFDVGATDPGRIVISGEGETPEVAMYQGNPAEVVKAFLDETGRPPLPPAWLFRPWMSGNEWNTQARVLAEVRRSLAEGIPVGAVVIEAWSDEATFTAFRDAEYEVHPDGAPHRLSDFRFPEDGAWPDPKAMVEELHAVGVRVLLWQIPLVPSDKKDNGQVEADLATMEARGFAVREADGGPYRNRGWWFPGALLPDWTNPEARAWWLAKRRYLVEELGIDGFKTDGGEHAWGHDLRYHDGTRGDEGNNLFPVRFAAAYHELVPHGVTFSRAGFTGSAAFPAHWAGDENSTWEGFRDSITAGLTAGVGGIFFWGWDLAGFSGEIPDAELYLRSAAAACFAPVMQYHSEFNHHREPGNDRTPWNIAARTGDDSVLAVFRKFAVLRETLVPYLVEQAEVAIGTGRPLMRPLCFDHPRDETVWQWPFQWMLGDELLVAPVIRPGTATWRVYLPQGEWADFFTGERHTGPVVVERAVPLDEIPVYGRISDRGSQNLI